MNIDNCLVRVIKLKKHFPVYGGFFLRRKGWIYAVDDVSLDVKKGETLGIVGESGCGKTTLGRCIAGLYKPNYGNIIFQGQDISRLGRKKLKTMHLKMQMIFQDPVESLNPRHTIGQILKEKYDIHNKRLPDMDEEISGLLEKVGLSPGAMTKFPHEFSGGERQRIGIARAISLNPDMIVCDEPVSALDVSVQSQILNLLLKLQREMNFTYMFISHDLSVVRHISDRIAVMYLGRIVEIAEADSIYNNPCHPYTEALLSSIPVPDPNTVKKRIILTGEVPSPENPPPGCRFHTRCPYAEEICKYEEPVLGPIKNLNDSHLVACHLKKTIAGGSEYVITAI